MINELDDVILTCDLPEHGLSAGDIGTVVLVHRRAAGYEVETAGSAEDAMPRLERADVILTDLRLPGEDGPR